MEIRKLLQKLLKERDTLSFSGRAVLTATDPKTGKVVAVVKSKNIIVTVGKQFIGDMLIDLDASHDTGLTYCAIGTGTTTPLVTDTTLTTEAARKTITSKSRNGIEITLSTFFTKAESTLNIKEGGIFGHSTASGSADSGKLLAHWLSAFDNSLGNFDITLDYILSIG